jgi:uncharacterized membrane protein
MKKMTLSLILFLMKHQGHDGKYRKMEKVSFFLTFFSFLFITGAIRIIDRWMLRDQSILTWLISWVIALIVHLVWIYRLDKSKLHLHYKEYKMCLIIFLIIMFGGIGLHALADYLERWRWHKLF